MNEDDKILKFEYWNYVNSSPIYESVSGDMRLYRTYHWQNQNNVDKYFRLYQISTAQVITSCKLDPILPQPKPRKEPKLVTNCTAWDPRRMVIVDCPTDNPTADPTIYPTEIPTRSPSQAPTDISTSISSTTITTEISYINTSTVTLLTSSLDPDGDAATSDGAPATDTLNQRFQTVLLCSYPYFH